MGKEKTFSSEELENTTIRVQNDSELIKRGAKYVADESGPRLEVTKDAIKDANEEMLGEIKNQIKKCSESFIRLCNEEEKQELGSLLKEISLLPFNFLEYTSTNQKSFSGLVSHNWRNFLASFVGQSSYGDRKFDFYKEIATLPLLFRSYLEPSQTAQEESELIESILKSNGNGDGLKNVTETLRGLSHQAREYGWHDENENDWTVLNLFSYAGQLTEKGFPFNETYGRVLYILAYESMASGFRPATAELHINRTADEVIEIIKRHPESFKPQEIDDYIKKMETARKILLAAAKSKELVNKVMSLAHNN